MNLTFLFNPSNLSLSRTFLSWMSLASFSLSSSMNSLARLCVFRIWSSNRFVTSKSFYKQTEMLRTYLELSWCLQLHFLFYIGLPIEEFKEANILGAHLHFLLRSAISMTEYGDDRSEFPPVLMDLLELQRPIWSLITLTTVWARHGNRILTLQTKQSLVCHGALQIDREFSHDDLADLVSAVLIILFGSFHEGEAIDVTHIGVAFGSQHVKAANILLETDRYFPCDILLLLREIHRIANFFAIFVSLDNSVQRWALSGLGMGIVRSDSINLNIEAISLQEFLVNVRPVPADLTPLWVGEELWAIVVDLSK